MTHEEIMIAYLERVQEAMADFREKADDLIVETLDYYANEEMSREMAWYLQEQDVAISHATEHVERAQNDIQKLLDELKGRV